MDRPVFATPAPGQSTKISLIALDINDMVSELARHFCVSQEHLRVRFMAPLKDYREDSLQNFLLNATLDLSRDVDGGASLGSTMDELILKFPKSFHLQYAQDMSATDRARLKEPRTKLGVWSEKDTSVVERGVMLYEELWGCNRQQTMASVTNWLKKEPYKRSDPPDNSDGILLLLGIIETQLNLNAHDCALAIVAACSHREPSPSIAPVVGRVPTSHDFRPGGPLCSILERCIVVTQNQYGIPDSKAVKYLQGFASQTADVFWSALHAATIIQGGLTGFAKINRFKKLVYAAMQPQASANTPTASMSTVQSWTNAYGWRPSLFAYWGNLTLSEVEAMSVSPILTKQHLRLLSTS